MKTFTAQNGDKLDQIAYNTYGTLEHFTKVVEANPHLVNKPILSDGDVVNLPVIEVEKTKVSEVKSLW